MSYAQRADRFDADLAASAAAKDSDTQLIALLSRTDLDDRERTEIIAALGESGTGAAGSAAVRAQFGDAMTKLATATKDARSGWRDLACAAVIALATREGPGATDVYLAAAASANATVRDYGLMVLAAEGDDRAWDQVLATVSDTLGRKRISYGRWYDMLNAIGYLARHATLGSDRAQQLISLLRASWRTLARPPQKSARHGPYAEPQLETATRPEDLWPGIQPGGPPPDAIDLPHLHTPLAWWRPDFRPPPPPRKHAATSLGNIGPRIPTPGDSSPETGSFPRA